MISVVKEERLGQPEDETANSEESKEEEEEKPGYDFLKAAMDDPDSWERSLTMMTTPEILDTIKMVRLVCRDCTTMLSTC